jgi:hypothetical protein
MWKTKKTLQSRRIFYNAERSLAGTQRSAQASACVGRGNNINRMH